MRLFAREKDLLPPSGGLAGRTCHKSSLYSWAFGLCSLRFAFQGRFAGYIRGEEVIIDALL